MLFQFSSAINPLFHQPHEEQSVRKEGDVTTTKTPSSANTLPQRCLRSPGAVYTECV